MQRKLFALALSLMVVAFAQAQKQKKVSSTKKPIVAQQLKTFKDSMSYALGISVGQRLAMDSTVDAFLVLQALQTVIHKKTPLLTEQTIGAIFAQAEEKQKAEQEAFLEAEKKKKAIEASINKERANEFLAQNKQRKEVVTTPSGLQYEILKKGEGVKPVLNQKAKCHYAGSLLSGEEFDNSYKRGEPISFPLQGVIKGWTEALQLMPVGSKWKLYIPSDLAYGDMGRGAIPPGAMLIFEIELLDIE